MTSSRSIFHVLSNVRQRKVLVCGSIAIAICFAFVYLSSSSTPIFVETNRINNSNVDSGSFRITNLLNDGDKLNNKNPYFDGNSKVPQSDGENDARFLVPTVTPPSIQEDVIYSTTSPTPASFTANADTWFRLTAQAVSNLSSPNSLVPEMKVESATASFTSRPLYTYAHRWSNPDGEATVNPFCPDVDFVLQNKNLCRNASELEWIIYVHSGASNADRRQALRRTWASEQLFKRPVTKVAFMIGMPTEPHIFQALLQEFKEYGDLVVGNFMDSYRNLTLKSIMALKWVSTYCTNAKHALKTDDDVFLNIVEVITLIKKQPQQTRLITCPVFNEKDMPILRDPKSCMKWCAEPTDFPGDMGYPRYCSGTAYTLSVDIMGDMYQAALRTRFFFIDDVFTTGLLPLKLQYSINYVDFKFDWDGEKTKADYASDGAANYYAVMLRETYEYYFQRSLYKLTAEQRLKLHKAYSVVCYINKCRE